jgi:energy-coupling factor transport system ATP-binding protein
VKGELLEVWKDTRLIVLAAQIAAIYAAVLIPFKVGIPIIPGFVELRPANAIPVVASLLFGPAAAWGAAFGNLIGDLFGTLGPGSLFGALGNFLYGYVPYRLWGRLGPLSTGCALELRSPKQIMEFVVVCVLASLACAGTIGWGLDVMHLLPFQVVFPAIFINNVLMSTLLGPPLLLFLYPRVARWGLLYADIRHDLTEARAAGGALASKAESPADLPQSSGITIQGLRFTYRGAAQPALHGLSVALPPGTMTVILGGSGSGKSTLCLCLNGLIPHYVEGTWQGTVLVGGQDSRHRTVSQSARTVGLLFQDFEAQLVSTSVEHELMFTLGNLYPGLPLRDIASRVTDTLALVGLEDCRRRDPLSLSGGERQRLAIAAVLAPRPPVLVLDDPTTDLDPAGREALYALLRTLQAQGTTVVVTDHETEEAALAGHACLLSDGGLAWDGSAGQLLRRPALMEQCGVRPLPLPVFFARLGCREDLPVTPDEAAARLQHRSVRIDAPVEGLSSESQRAQPVIECRGVGFAYSSGSRAALDHVDLAIGRGEFVAVIGSNGSGKTTLAKLFKGLLLPTRGEVRVDGQETRRMTAGRLAATVGYVFQNPDHQIFADTVREEVAFGPRNLGVPAAEIPERVREALEAVELDRPEIATVDPFSLTKGDRQRVAVASVLATRPDILIFDEPTTGLDYREIHGMMGLIRRLNRAGHTIVMITHLMWVVAEYAARCVVMEAGRVVADEGTRAVFSQPERLDRLGLRLPQVPRFTRRYGRTLLTLDELETCFRIE